MGSMILCTGFAVLCVTTPPSGRGRGNACLPGECQPKEDARRSRVAITRQARQRQPGQVISMRVSVALLAGRTDLSRLMPYVWLWPGANGLLLDGRGAQQTLQSWRWRIS
jgi:hypothetical protein